jgi:hypothetical protein
VYSIVSFSFSFYEPEKEVKGFLEVSFSYRFYEPEKEVKVCSSRENEWLNNMHLCSKMMELT